MFAFSYLPFFSFKAPKITVASFADTKSKAWTDSKIISISILLDKSNENTRTRARLKTIRMATSQQQMNLLLNVWNLNLNPPLQSSKLPQKSSHQPVQKKQKSMKNNVNSNATVVKLGLHISVISWLIRNIIVEEVLKHSLKHHRNLQKMAMMTTNEEKATQFSSLQQILSFP